MTKRSEAQRIRFKKEHWDEALAGFDKWWRKTWKETKKMMNIIFDWYFFYQSKNAGEKAMHIIMWILVTLTGLRVLGLI